MSTPYRAVTLTPYLTRREAADYLGVSERTVDRYIATSKLHADRVGPRLIRIPLSSIEAFLAGGAR